MTRSRVGEQLGLERIVLVPDAPTLRMRTTIRPYLSLLTSLLEVFGDYDRGAPPGWLSYVRERSAGLDLEPLMVLPEALRIGLPNFLVPDPVSPFATVADDLARVRDVSLERIQADLREDYGDDVPPEHEPYLRDHRAALARFCDAAAAYWDRVFAARERELVAVLERELMGLMHTLATVGVESMLTRVHPRITFTDGALRIPASPAPTETTDVTGRCLWLAPLLCGPDASMSTFGRPDLIVLGYPARGVASFWGDAAQPAPDGLQILLGATRARVAVAVAEPGTTSDLARELKVAPATVSHHLSALSEAGIVDSRRTGRRVYYALTGRGRRVIASFS